ncbi:hypothetical protein [Pelagibius sp.]|uniref:hypothetical protein n=1 Tax=Pelagibius sp. TaxID=1931238 RepID=UPI0026212124|nr:hypothetical protein [Pelagibius sp.]
MDELTAVFSKLDVLGQILLGGFLISCVIGFFAWCAVMMTATLLPFNTVPGAIRGWLRLNPLNVIFYGDLLTPRGLALRRWLLRAVLIFFGALALGAALGAAALHA